MKKKKYFRRATGKGFFEYVEKKKSGKEIPATLRKWKGEIKKIREEREVKTEFFDLIDYRLEEEIEKNEPEGIGYAEGEGEGFVKPTIEEEFGSADIQTGERVGVRDIYDFMNSGKKALDGLTIEIDLAYIDAKQEKRIYNINKSNAKLTAKDFDMDMISELEELNSNDNWGYWYVLPLFIENEIVENKKVVGYRYTIDYEIYRMYRDSESRESLGGMFEATPSEI